MGLSVTCLLLFGLILCAFIIAFFTQSYNNDLGGMLYNFREVSDKNAEIKGGREQINGSRLIIDSPVVEVFSFPPGRTF